MEVFVGVFGEKIKGQNRTTLKVPRTFTLNKSIRGSASGSRGFRPTSGVQSRCWTVRVQPQPVLKVP